MFQCVGRDRVVLEVNKPSALEAGEDGLGRLLAFCGRAMEEFGKVNELMRKMI